jgi:hypothetical protein
LTYPVLLGIEESETEAKGFVQLACDALRPFDGAAAPLERLALALLDREN